MTGNNTDYRTKGRAVFLAAIMVLSMVAVPIAFTGGAAAAAGDGDANLDSGSTFWQGQELGVTVDTDEQDSNNEYQIREVDDNEVGNLVDEFTTNPSGETNLSTDSLDTGDYVVVAAGNNSAPIEFEEGTSVDNSSGVSSSSFEIAVQNLDTEFEDDSVDNDGDTTAELTFDSNRGTYDVEVSADGLDSEELYDIFNSSDDFTEADNSLDQDTDDDVLTVENVSDDTYDLNFQDIDEGDYEFTFDVTDTTAEDSANITVNEIGEGELGFTNGTFEGAQGGVVPITVTFEDAADEGTLLIGNEDDDGYQANVSIDADGEDEVTVLFNTYTAGNNSSAPASDVVAIADEDDSDASITGFEQNGLNDILDTGDYELAVSSGNANTTLDDPDTLATLFVDERETTAMNLWRASPDTADDLEEVSDITAGIEAGNVTQTDIATDEDVVVHQVEATGLNGLLEDAGANVDDDQDVTSQFAASIADEQGVNLTVEQTNPTSNQEPAELNASAGGVTVLASPAGDQVFVIVDLTEAEFEQDGDDYTVEDGDEFEPTFTVVDDRLLDSDDDDDHEEVSATFGFEEAEYEWAEDPYNATSTEEENFTGTSNIAPGHEFDVRIRGSGDARFINTEEDNVLNSDGEVTASFDLSDREVGEEYNLQLRTGGDTEAEVSGEIVEEAAPAAFEVSGLDPADVSVEQGDVIEVSATIENTGEEEATQDVTFQVDGNELGSEEVTLDGGEDTTVTFSDIDTSDLEPGDYEHGVFTDDSEQTATLTVEEVSEDDGETDDGETDDGETDDGETDDGETDDGDDDGETDDEGGVPGFGVIVALIALIGAAMLAARRQN